jgi:hypothetical protein
MSPFLGRQADIQACQGRAAAAIAISAHPGEPTSVLVLTYCIGLCGGDKAQGGPDKTHKLRRQVLLTEWRADQQRSIAHTSDANAHLRGAQPQLARQMRALPQCWLVMPKGHIVSFQYASSYSSLRGGGHFDKLFYQDKKKEKTLFAVPTKTLDVLMQENGHEYIDILKIDISGEFELMYSLVS